MPIITSGVTIEETKEVVRPRFCEYLPLPPQGVQVQREETFQAGDGRCVFRIKLDEPVDTTAFEMEPPPGKS